jgi:hypothetical protein
MSSGVSAMETYLVTVVGSQHATEVVAQVHLRRLLP